MKKRKINNGKNLALMSILFFLLFCISLRLIYIMIFKSEQYSNMAREQWTSEIKVYGKRGKILDRNKTELAVSANVYRVDLNLPTIISYSKNKNIKLDDIAQNLSNATGLKIEEVKDRLNLRTKSGTLVPAAILVRSIEKEKADKVKTLKIDGVVVSSDTKRYYPNNNFAAHVLGNTNSDGIGLNGVELKYNKELAGIPGMRITEMDGRSGEFPYAVPKYTPPVDGKDVILTIDEKIQFSAEKIADRAIKEYNPDSITIIVMNPNNGEILAMVNKPDFNPNNPYVGYERFSGSNVTAKMQKMWRNRAVSDSFEPGSIFKVLTSAAAVQEGIAGKDETYYCPGFKKFGNVDVRCWKGPSQGGHGTITFDQALENSCNVAFMDIGAKLGKEKLYSYLNDFGLGKKSGVDLPGETPGILKPIENVIPMDLGTISFGQTNTLNFTQYMTSLNVIANGGKLIQPHVMKEISHINSNGDRVIDEVFHPHVNKVPISNKTCARVKEAMESAVSKGSVKSAGVKGYRIAGKTGTGEKVNPKTGKYDSEKEGYLSSFVGFAPVDDPKVSVLIAIDHPRGGQYFGGIVAAPYAHDLFTDIFTYMESNEIKTSDDEKYVIVPDVRGKKISVVKDKLKKLGIEESIEGKGKFVMDISPKPGSLIGNNEKINLYTGSSSNYNKDVIVPNLDGYNEDNAKKILESIGLKATFEGKGVVVNQSVPFGDLLNNGDNIKLTLSNKEEN
ncbi:stage V sporulation protein D [Clostridium tarantellae]|uniref:Stage V sporulation protein D n=1 Tax=Clostridium tarantellae TaxID=39493 RepID=A0A6I1MNK8_9CLOT|nr:stage V sporulation protein D [Clostridium tarantellae]MPQ43687.1 stage V sporulation protein D [Clostridium tarantellae]